MILSDRSIREALDQGRIAIDPLGDNAIQPSSVDLRVDAEFRVFNNHLYPYIDVRQEQPDLTESLTVEQDQPFILHPGEFVLGSTLEKVTLPNDLVARIEGKALALDTPVPTPAGWSTMGELQPGDLLYAGDGTVTMVVAATDVMRDRPCYRVGFSDGTEVVADAAHLWRTTDRYERRHNRAGSLRTTEEIGQRLKEGPNDVHRVAECPPLDGVTKDLPGYVDTLGRCDLTTVKPHLAEQYHEPVASLVFPPTTVDKRAMLDGRYIAAKWEAQFTPDRPVFRLPRELARQKTTGSFNRGRSIVAVDPVPSVPVRCIQVAEDDGMFLITRSFIPTHNSSLGRLGLLVHATAGFVDAGFSGWLTLELSNVANLPIAIYPQMKIGQLAFFQLDRAPDRAYGDAALGSKYQGQRGPTASQYYRNFDQR